MNLLESRLKATQLMFGKFLHTTNMLIFGLPK